MSTSIPTTKHENRLSGILTIGIPVFEEEEGLAETLSSIGNLEEFKSGEIEVVVWDNNSQDLSYQVAFDFALRFPKSVYVGCNPSNLGMRENLRQVLKRANSKFVWIIGAGEQITPSSLAPLLQFLGDTRNSAVSMGTVEAHPDLELQDISGSKWEIQTFEPHSQSCFVETVSLSIVSSRLALQVVDSADYREKDQFHLWPHLELALIATSDKTFKVVSPHLVKVSANPMGWWYHGSQALGIYLNQVKLLKAHSQIVGWVQDRLADRTGWHFAKFAFEIKVEGTGLKAIELIEARRAGIQRGPLLVALVIALSPKAILLIAQSGFRRLMGK